MKKGELICAAVFIIVAVIIIASSVRLGFGWEEQIGPQAGFVPFWLGVLLLLSGAITLVSGLRMKVKDAFFLGRSAMVEAGRVLLTALIFTVLIVYLGIYIATIVYAALFSRWLGEYRWRTVVAFAVITTLVVFYGMEKGLTIPLPKSPLYDRGWFIF